MIKDKKTTNAINISFRQYAEYQDKLLTTEYSVSDNVISGVVTTPRGSVEHIQLLDN